ncbi:MAG TPA: protoporphyrinogen oxidase [Terriglobia bacterium]|nr:protoporphyrinogen oxidase [Terriglobia bacterium]
MLDRELRRIIVVGGGMAGLTAAYRLGQARRHGAPVDECLIEASSRLGGVVQTDRADGCVIEAGPDSFLTEKPEAAALARELGLGDSLIGSNDAGRRTYILHRGRLRPMPDGLLLMVPSRLWPVLTTPLIPFPSKIAIAREWLTGRPPGGLAPEGDESVASFIARHFGRGMLDSITEPLLAGVYGGDPERLSLRSVLARFRDLEAKYGSLTRAGLALRKQMGAAGRRPIFTSFRDGLGSLVEALAGRIESDRVELQRRVVRLEELGLSLDGRRYRLVLEDGSSREADAVILAIPAWAAAKLLADLDNSLSAVLTDIPYNSATTVALVYDGGVRARLPQGFGFLVPRVERRRLLACTFVHAKFDHRAPGDRALLRCFLGGSRDSAILEASDEEILQIVRDELASILGIRDQPLVSRICRWPNAMAQYEVGHAERLRTTADRLSEHPGVYLAGNAYFGIGISDVIRTGEAAAREAIGLAPAATVAQHAGRS